jgi:hypothetical protein
MNRLYRGYLLCLSAVGAILLSGTAEAFSSGSYNSRLQHGHRHRHRLLRTTTCAFDVSSSGEKSTLIIGPDYLITDSLELNNRPSFSTFLVRPRNILGLSVISAGVGIAACNLVGTYGDFYVALQQISIGLATANAAADYKSSQPPYETTPVYGVSPNVRCGCIDDALVHRYAATYTAAAAWLALRTSVVCPEGIMALDPVARPSSVLIFAFSLAAPAFTIIHHYKIADLENQLRFMVGLARNGDRTKSALPSLSDTELFRAQSLVAIGIVGCIFAPEAMTLTLRGQDWWCRVSELHPGQQWIESTNALFGVYATQASMLAHRAGKLGVAPYSVLVPAFTVVCFVLTILPSACSLYWWGDKISFLEFYTE